VKALLILKILTETLFIMLVAAYRKPAVTVKLTPKPVCDTGLVNRYYMFIKVDFSSTQ
jgi:hypothetical protein